jgi:L-seryl-tRNA(Ser) seleniumtransferase
MPAVVVAVRSPDISVEDFARRLRIGSPAVVGRVNDDRILLDVRTVFPEQEDDLVSAVRAACDFAR